MWTSVYKKRRKGTPIDGVVSKAQEIKFHKLINGHDTFKDLETEICHMILRTKQP
jgi:hypothetical protein